ncbi:MAG: hypothetical protein RIC56_18985 [Pseudomonadales bacterium]
MWSNRLVVALLAAALATPALAAPAETDTAAARNEPNKRVCRTIKVTGSQIRQRVCHKQKEWDRMREEAQEAMRKGGHRVSEPQQQ